MTSCNDKVAMAEESAENAVRMLWVIPRGTIASSNLRPQRPWRSPVRALSEAV